MATSEPLVPTNRPQGSRQETRAGMLQAGIPLAPPAEPGQAGAAPPGVPPGGPTPRSAAALDLSQTSPDQFPFLGDNLEQPNVPAPVSEPNSVFGALALSAQSEFARAVLAQVANRQNE